ncbi:MAG: hypothetical protein H0V17_14455, partial [Deltaproteobacteria bacterium]|nr:hypothetical protein [Deltaproteobacteria bacterium]
MLVRSEAQIARRMKVRTIAVTALVVGAVIFVFWYQRRERAAELAAAASSASASGSAASATTSTPSAGSAASVNIRKIEKPRR